MDEPRGIWYLSFLGGVDLSLIRGNNVVVAIGF